MTLEPVDPPIIIPPQGGSFEYSGRLTNSETSAQSVHAWTMVTLPNGNEIGPILGPVTLTLPGGGSVEQVLTLNVPGRAPGGVYTYRGFVGIYPNEIWSRDSFTFTKTAGR